MNDIDLHDGVTTNIATWKSDVSSTPHQDAAISVIAVSPPTVTRFSVAWSVSLSAIELHAISDPYCQTPCLVCVYASAVHCLSARTDNR